MATPGGAGKRGSLGLPCGGIMRGPQHPKVLQHTLGTPHISIWEKHRENHCGQRRWESCEMLEIEPGICWWATQSMLGTSTLITPTMEVQPPQLQERMTSGLSAEAFQKCSMLPKLTNYTVLSNLQKRALNASLPPPDDGRAVRILDHSHKQ